MTDQIPLYSELLQPVVDAIRKLGGSGTVREIEAEILEASPIPNIESDEKALKIFRNRLSWARSYLKKAGYLNNSQIGVWALSPKGLTAENIDRSEVMRVGRSMEHTNPADETSESGGESDWTDDVIAALKNLSPKAFEVFCVRLLREAGFEQLEVTGRSGDEGIDGKGIMLVGGLLSYHVLFQAKRYKDTVGSGAVRDFRGAIAGRTDKGLIISTGRFTPSAISEATRDGVVPIDLIDGLQLAQLMKKLGLGVQIEMIESVQIKPEWFVQFQGIR